MFYVYIIKSLQEDWYYVGMSEDVEKRLESHNKGEVKSTKFKRPYLLIYKEEHELRNEARKREKQLKNGHYKKRFIENLKKDGRGGSSTG